MAQEITLPVMSPRLGLLGLPCFRVPGVKSLTGRCLGLGSDSALLAAMLKRNQLLRAVGGG